MTVLAPVVTGIVSQYFGINVGIVAGEICRMLPENAIPTITDYFSMKYKLIINEKLNEELNPVFEQCQRYLFKKYTNNIKSATLHAEYGNYTLNINKSNSTKLYDYFENGCIKITIRQARENNTDVKTIVLESKTLNIEKLQSYVKTICTVSNLGVNKYTIYHSVKHKRKDYCVVKWNSCTITSSKSIHNTILSADVNENMIGDIEWFMNNEEWHTKRGIPYKRGYVIHGPPGTGKTSIVKSLANHYQMPIFSPSIEELDDDSLNQLVSDINHLSNGKKYILLFEDVDTSSLFKKDLFHYRKKQLTISNFLNILDGIMEAYGRITIMTMNNTQLTQEFPAIVRPGRIDKIINVTYCDADQICRLFMNFYPDKEIDINLVKIHENNVCPAQIVKICQTNNNDPLKTLNILYSNNDTMEDVTCENNTVNTKRLRDINEISRRRIFRRNRRINRLKSITTNIEQNKKLLDKLQKKQEEDKIKQRNRYKRLNKKKINKKGVSKR